MKGKFSCLKKYTDLEIQMLSKAHVGDITKLMSKYYTVKLLKTNHKEPKYDSVSITRQNVLQGIGNLKL